jgi:hypothetical protein
MATVIAAKVEDQALKVGQNLLKTNISKQS